MSSPTVRIEVSGARGESFADVARRTGLIGDTAVPPGATDAEVLALLTSEFAAIVAAAPYTVLAEVKAAATGNVTVSNPGTAVFDGVTLTNGQRLLLPAQSSGAENGIYQFNGSGSALTRVTDFDQTAEVVQGSYVRVTGGATMAGAWVLVTADPITVGTTAQVWNRFDTDVLEILARSTGAGAVGTTGGDVQSDLDALAAADTALDGRLDTVEASLAAGVTAPVNLAPNSQWEIFSAHVYARRIKADGTGLMDARTVSAYTTGGTESDVTITGDISSWFAGMLVKIDNSATAIDADLYSYPLRIQEIAGQVITLRTHLGAAIGTTLVGTSNIEPVNIGCGASAGTGEGADGWKKSTTLLCWREDNATNLAKGAIHALGLMKQSASEEYYRCELNAAHWKGRRLAIGIGVNQKVRGGSGTWCVYIETDGTGGTTSTSADASTASGYQWLEKSVTVPADATYVRVGIKLKGANNDVYHCINPVIAATSLIGAWNYVKPQETLIPVVKVEPTPWINGTIAFPASANLPVAPQTPTLYSFYTDFYAASGGAIARSVRLARGNIEGYNSNTPPAAGVGVKRLVGFADKNSDPLRLSGFMAQTVRYSFTGPSTLNELPDKSYVAGMNFPMVDGACWCFGGIASDGWSNVSIDLDEFTLLNSGVPA